MRCRGPSCSRARSTPATLAASLGALGAFIAFTRKRRDSRGAAYSADPFQLQALGKAAADIETSINQHLHDVERVYDQVATGQNAPVELILQVRRNQVRNTHRALAAVDDLFLHAGGNSLRRPIRCSASGGTTTRR